MRVERRYLVEVVQVYEGDPPNPPPDYWGDEVKEWDDYLDGDQDQYICDNWRLVDDYTILLDDDQLQTRVIE